MPNIFATNPKTIKKTEKTITPEPNQCQREHEILRDFSRFFFLPVIYFIICCVDFIDIAK